MVANLQRSTVRDALNQFREPWAMFQRHSPVQFYIMKDTRACNLINYELSLHAIVNTPLPEAVHVITDSQRSLAATEVVAAC